MGRACAVLARDRDALACTAGSSHWQLRYQPVNIRTTLSAGASYLLFDLVGATKGRVGPFFGVSLLGVEWKVARGFYLTIDPTYIAIPVPHVTGLPFAYTQYRFLLGLEFGG